MNAIYKVIFNRATGKPVVVSELGKGKLKSSASRAVKSAILLAIVGMNASVSASICNVTSMTCQLDQQWSYLNNNNRAGGVKINDGQMWDVSGVNSWLTGDTSFVQYKNLKNVLADGYTVVKDGAALNSKTALPQLQKLVFSGLQTISITDPITNAPKSVSVFSSSGIVLEDSYEFPYHVAFLLENAPVYINTNLIDVSSGVANISLGNNNYVTGEIRNSNLVNVDGALNKAEVNWNSSQLFSIKTANDWGTTPSSADFLVESDTFKGTFTAFDKSQHTVNNISDLIIYNDWLISQMVKGNLTDENAYKAALEDAYERKSEIYSYSPFPNNSDASSYGTADSALIHASGKFAQANISKGVTLEVSSGSKGAFKIISAENDAVVINNGYVSGTGALVDVKSGASFVNNGVVSVGGGGLSSYNNGYYYNYPLTFTGLGSNLINNGSFNINAVHAYSTKELNGRMFGVYLDDGSHGINKGEINSGYWGGGVIPQEYTSSIISVRVINNGSFVNDVTGLIKLGVGEDGNTSSYLNVGSAAIQAYSNGTAINDGRIILGSKADGVYGLMGVGNNVNLVNNGTIDVNSDGDNGLYTPAQSIGVFSNNSVNGTIDNRGTINLNGANNVGVKAIDGGKATSTGVINVNISSGQSSMNNYGVWVEGNGSQIEISGNINLNGDKTIGVHARNKGTISLTGNSSISFVSGQNQIGYFV